MSIRQLNDTAPNSSTRWLTEAKNTQPYMAYRNASTIEAKDQAVADGLADVLENGDRAFSNSLNSALGFGFLGKWMDSFKWENLDKNNPFIRLLNIIAGYGDGKPIKSVLTKKTPQEEKNVQQPAKVDQPTEQPQTPTTQPQTNTESYVRWFGNRLNEDNDENGGGDWNTSALDNVLKNAKKKQGQSQQEPQQPQQQKAEPSEMNNTVAKVFDLSPRELFSLLYNGYIKHLYTTNDFALANNRTDDNELIKTRDGKVYSISKDLRDVIAKCFGDNDWRNISYNKVDNKQTTVNREITPNEIRNLRNAVQGNEQAINTVNKIERNMNNRGN